MVPASLYTFYTAAGTTAAVAGETPVRLAGAALVAYAVGRFAAQRRRVTS